MSSATDPTETATEKELRSTFNPAPKLEVSQTELGTSSKSLRREVKEKVQTRTNKRPDLALIPRQNANKYSAVVELSK